MKKHISILLIVIIAFSFLDIFQLTISAAESYLWPVPSNTKTSQNYSSTSHKGIDISGSTSYDIVSTKSGTVIQVFSGCNNQNAANTRKSCTSATCKMYNTNYQTGGLTICNYGFGRGVVVQNSDGTYACYAHMSSVSVKNGASVKQGQVLGKMGNYGYSAGVHLHFSISTGSWANYNINNTPSTGINYIYSMTYNIAYNANGGTGTMASRTITEGTTFTPSKCTFTKSGYYFAGYNVCRKSDSKWYVSGKGWLTNSEITNSGYTKAVYNNGTNYVFNGSWVNGVNPGETYTFYPIWKPNSTKLWFYPNYSGCNYVMGGGLDSRMSSYINSRDTSIYTLSVDSSQRLNNQNSIKIVATSAGSSGHDMKIATSTNWGLTSGVTGDNRKMTLTFWAKSSVSGAKMYFCWANNSTYKNVTLTNEWKKYSIDMTKNIYSGGSIHPYMDKAGTFWINSLTLCDGSNGTNNYTRYEDGYTIPNQVYNYGDTYNSLPTPVRDGYKFVGWYTQNEGGTQITTSTKVFDYDTNVYAHWEKEISNAPIEDIILPNGREYALYDNAVSWEKAKELCESAGGHLVTINSQEENDLIYEIVKDKNNFLWLGAKLNENTQQWEWITGEEFGYTNWDTGEPNSPSSEFYAQMYPAKLGFGNNAGCWNDSFGELSAWHSYFGFQNSMYICEFEPLYGDTDGDREITITDATNIQKSIVSLMDFSDEQTKYFDINNDGKKDIKDVSLIQKIVAGIITAWRVSEY